MYADTQPELLFPALGLIGLAGAVCALAVGSPLAASAVVAAVVCVMVARANLHPPRVWYGAVLILLSGYIVLSRGFAYLRPFGSAAPIFVGEVVIAIALLSLPHWRTFRYFTGCVFGRLVLVWLLFGAAMIAIAIPTMTFTAAKATSLVYYGVFAYFGFAAALQDPSFDNARRLLGYTFILHTIHVWAGVFYGGIWRTSPIVYDNIYLFSIGEGGMPYINTVGAAFYFLTVWPGVFGSGSLIAYFLSMCSFAVLPFVQARTSFIAAGVSWITLALFMRVGRMLASLATTAAILTLALMALQASGVEIRGYKGPVNFGFLENQLASIAGVAPSGQFTEYESALLGPREGRLEIWQDILDETFRANKWFLGGGFSESLLEIPLQNGSIKRSPHNAFVAVFGYLGVVGLALFILTIASALLTTFSAIRRLDRSEQATIRDVLVWTLIYQVCNVVGSCFGVVFDSPVHAAPAYFVMGLAVGLAFVHTDTHSDVASL